MVDGWVCYTLLTPDQIPFYVGAGTKRRLRSYQRNSEACSVLEEIRSKGLKVVRVVETFSNKNDAFARELELILKYGRRMDGGLLTNMRIGDRGGVQGRVIGAEQRQQMSARASGYRHSDETRARMAQSKIGNQNRRGYVYSEEERKLRSEQTRAGIARKRAERENHGQ